MPTTRAPSKATSYAVVAIVSVNVVEIGVRVIHRSIPSFPPWRQAREAGTRLASQGQSGQSECRHLCSRPKGITANGGPYP